LRFAQSWLAGNPRTEQASFQCHLWFPAIFNFPSHLGALMILNSLKHP
jgi:hypothetical protein